MFIALQAANQSSAFALQSSLADESLLAGRTAIDEQRSEAAGISNELIGQIGQFSMMLAEFYAAAEAAISSENADQNDQTESTSAGGRGGRSLNSGDRHVRALNTATGDIKLSPVEGAPKQGWLRCDGTERDIQTCRHLFDKIGNRFGQPSRAESFRLPGPLPLDATLAAAGYDWLIRT
jgi:hypothetical protein